MADAEGNRYGPYDIEIPGSEAEAFTEDAWFDLNGHLSGVKSGGALTFAGLTATLTAIDARVHGSYLMREDPWSAASTPTSTASPRRDMLVARRQRTSGEGESAVPGKTFLLILQGTPAATPADPAFDPVNDEPLWSWRVPGSGGTVVTDVRDLRRPFGKHARAYTVGAYTGAAVNGPISVLRTITYPDPGFPHRLMVDAVQQALVSPGSVWNFTARIDTTAGTLIRPVGSATSTAYATTQIAGGVSAVLTGGHTVLFQAERISGAPGAGYQVNPEANLQQYRVVVVPE